MPKTKQQYVYFIQDKQSKAIKIGVAVDPFKRLKQLQTGRAYPLHLLGYIEGGRHREQAIHQQLAEHQMLGEWFEYQAVMEFLNTLRVEEWVWLSPVAAGNGASRGDAHKRYLKAKAEGRHREENGRKKRWRDCYE